VGDAPAHWQRFMLRGRGARGEPLSVPILIEVVGVVEDGKYHEIQESPAARGVSVVVAKRTELYDLRCAVAPGSEGDGGRAPTPR